MMRQRKRRQDFPSADDGRAEAAETTRLAPDGTGASDFGRKSLYADPGYRSALMAWTSRKAMNCWISCSGISCGRNSNMRIAGNEGDVLVWDNLRTLATMPKQIIAPMNRV